MYEKMYVCISLYIGCGASSAASVNGDVAALPSQPNSHRSQNDSNGDINGIGNNKGGTKRTPPGSALATVSTQKVFLLPGSKEELSAFPSTGTFSSGNTPRGGVGNKSPRVPLDALSEGGGLTGLLRQDGNNINKPPPSTPDAEWDRTEILSRLLSCRNCEEPGAALAVWCTECARAGDNAPPVLCEACNVELHQFAKTKSHIREGLGALHTSQCLSAKELGLSSPALPDKLPGPLETIVCSNCDGKVSVWCATCKTLLCTDCARDIHSPKLLRAHIRQPLSYKLILAEFKIIAKAREAAAARAAAGTPTGLLAGTGSQGKGIGAALLRMGDRTKVAPVTVVSSTLLPTRTGLGNGTSLANKRSMALELISKGKPSGITRDPNAASAIALSKIIRTKLRAALAFEGRDVPAGDENPGIPGDVFTFGDPALDGPINLTGPLEFRNLANGFDRLGGVQLVFITCGQDHAAAVTAMGSLFTWGSNVEGQLGCGNRLGTERWSAAPLLIELPRHAPVKSVACGAVHTLCLTHESRVYSWGDAKMGKVRPLSGSNTSSNHAHQNISHSLCLRSVSLRVVSMYSLFPAWPWI
jgi:hypothetical protein